jgi:hypothetical protein
MGVENMVEDGNSTVPNCVSRLHTLLPARKQRYPAGTYVGPAGHPGSCDVVFDGNWIEVKFAWTYYWRFTPYRQRNPSYRKHLLTDPHESAMKDVRVKLPRLIGRPEIRRIGFLLVCLHSPACPLPERDIDELELKGGLRDGSWTRSEVPDWPNPLNRGCLIRAYFWEHSALRG